MKKLKLEELEVSTLATSHKEDDGVKGGTYATSLITMNSIYPQYVAAWPVTIASLWYNFPPGVVGGGNSY